MFLAERAKAGMILVFSKTDIIFILENTKILTICQDGRVGLRH